MQPGTPNEPDPQNSPPNVDVTRCGDEAEDALLSGDDSFSELPNAVRAETSDDFTFLKNGDQGNTVDETMSPASETGETKDPVEIGRYKVLSKLGEGGFGSVYLAHDPKLNRKIAVKIPKLGLSPAYRNSFIEEGRSVARLKHPSIVSIFNIEETESGNPFVVMEFIEGPTLRTVIQEQGLTFSTSLNYLIQIAEALTYAHGETLIHRDIKPANVVISSQENRAKLMDFGMAIHDLTPNERLPSRPEGTPPYMSPEQVRGENHRLDLRTDIWAFGVLMYVMLTGQKPFRQKELSELAQAICLMEHRSPRSINKSVPEELARICQKCLEKLMSDRYQATQDLLNDLRSFETTWNQDLGLDPSISSIGILPTASLNKSESRTHSRHSVPSTTVEQTKKVKVIPKGLRSFDGQDAEFFVDLLPGPKDRFGVPESLRFWINRLSRDAEESVSVGMVFGPSGCGKSSFVKAGLIPRLEGVNTAYVEAAPGETEKRIIEKLAVVAPQVVQDEQNLDQMFQRLRRGHLLTGDKLLIVIDQFEQWLHSNSDLVNQPLVQALRQCDGKHLSCLLLVRDDFWMSATQFMAQLDLKVQEGVNALGIPLFDRRHARRVLTAYGQANEAFGDVITPKQTKFISDAIAEMSENGRVIPIHLALFSQMMDSDSWDSGELKKMGGWKGLGVHFLESIFADKRAAGYEKTCRAILGQLLPDVGSKIKGAKKSFRELLVSTDSRSPELLQQSLDFLDRELRIITPTESDATETEVQHFQLAHDYLVNPIGDWLSQKLKQTRRGRARVRLSELSAQWTGKRESRFLPSAFEYVNMRTAVNSKACTIEQRNYLKSADRHWAGSNRARGRRAGGIDFCWPAFFQPVKIPSSKRSR